jgi:hypothetical protein
MANRSVVRVRASHVSAFAGRVLANPRRASDSAHARTFRLIYFRFAACATTIGRRLGRRRQASRAQQVREARRLACFDDLAVRLEPASGRTTRSLRPARRASASRARSALQQDDKDNPMDTVYASPDQRDRFLNALDAQDIALCRTLAADLMNCSNALPGMTCEQLGLAPGSTYGCAARTVLAMPTS